jgi:hypothetical protein
MRIIRLCFFPQFALSNKLADLKRLALVPTKVGTKCLAFFASFFSCQRASALGTSQSVPRLAKRSKISEPK